MSTPEVRTDLLHRPLDRQGETTNPTKSIRRLGLRALFALVAIALLAAACASSSDEAETITLDNGALTPDSVVVPQIALEDLDPALRLPLELANGNQTTLTSYLGTPTVVNLWASWCAFCIAEMPDFEVVFQSVRPNVAFIGINIDGADDRAAADQLAIETGVTYDIAFDPNDAITSELGSIAMPATAFVNSAGEIVEIHNGQLTEDQLRKKIAELLAGDA